MIRTYRRRLPALLSIALAALLSGFLLSLAEAQTGTMTPANAADADTGLRLFAQRCSNCHGPQGLGDGELAANLPNPPAALADPAYLATAVPAEMFATILNGRQERGMPPFGPGSTNPLAEAQIWDAIAGVFSLGIPAGTIERGAALYETACADCHGAAGSAVEPDLAAAAYWRVRSDLTVIEALGEPAEHDFALSVEETAAVVAYARTLSYLYLDPARLDEPVALASVSGAVFNGTNGDPVGDNAVTLRIFDEVSMVGVMTGTVSAEGGYSFDLSDVPTNQLFLVQVNYDDLLFNSDIGRISQTRPNLDLPVTVFDKTTDARMISIDRLHVIVEFDEGVVVVNEFYQFGNVGTAVYVGPTGDPSQGTVVVSLPEGVQAPAFRRSFGSLQDFLPADDILPVADGWADPSPLFPGFGSLSLLVRYELPYRDAARIAHPLRYPAAEVNLVLTQVGVELANAAAWQGGQAQQMGDTSFVTYFQSALPAGQMMEIELTGRPSAAAAATAGGASQLLRDEQTELLVGGLALVLVMAVGLYFVNDWVKVYREQAALVNDPAALLEALAELDDLLAQGELSDNEYEQERAALKEHLLAIWE